MNTSLLIEKDGTIKIINIKNINKLYSVCNYRNDTNFELLYTWNYNNVNYELYGKKKSKGSVKNIYTMPYPINNEIFYGTLCVIKKINQELSNITLDDWDLITKNVKKENDNKDEYLNRKNEKHQEDIVKILFKNIEKELTHEEYEDE